MPSSSSTEPPSSIAMTPIERGWKPRRYSILREVFGPDFHGPSSSHTAAPQLIALEAIKELGDRPDEARVILYNSFATTGEGHKTHIAITAGLLGIGTTDSRTPNAIMIAEENKFFVEFQKVEDANEHPNTLLLFLSREGFHLTFKAISTGGGSYEVVTRQRIARKAA